jgi:signal transduction histidine kinase
MLSVENDGPLIPSSDVDRLLEPFQRLGRDRVPDGVGGSGLGLAIVRAVVDAHGGRLTVQSRPEGGLKVTVTFPMPAGRPRGEP